MPSFFAAHCALTVKALFFPGLPRVFSFHWQMNVSFALSSEAVFGKAATVAAKTCYCHFNSLSLTKAGTLGNDFLLKWHESTFLSEILYQFLNHGITHFDAWNLLILKHGNYSFKCNNSLVKRIDKNSHNFKVFLNFRMCFSHNFCLNDLNK